MSHDFSDLRALYGYSGQLNDQGQWVYYGRVGGVMVTGNEDGIKHVAMNVLYSLQQRAAWDAGARFDHPNPGYR